MKIIRQGTAVRGIGGKGCYWPSVARLNDGRIVLSYSGGRLNHICPFGRVEISYSSDEGKHWSMGIPVLDTPLDERDAGIIFWKGRTVLTTFNNTVDFQRKCLKKWPETWTDNEIIFLNSYLNCITPEIEKENLGSLVSFSSDGEHFESFHRVPVTSPHGPLPLSDGRLFYAGKAFSGNQSWTDTPLGNGLYTIFTDDGKHWSAPSALPEAIGFSLYEPFAIECEKGHILLSVRAHKEGELTVLLSDSFDGGKSFSPFRPTGICGSPPHLCRQGDNLILTYGRRIPPYGIRARSSFNNGLSWEPEISLRQDGLDWDLGYPASVALSDGSLLTVYYIKPMGGKLPEIQYTVWTI